MGPAEDDKAPWLEINCRAEFTMEAVSVWWAEINLDYARGILPEPVKYRLEFFDKEHRSAGEPVDRMDNTIDRIVDFVQFRPVRAQFVRLSFAPSANGLLHGVTELTAFGHPVRPGAK